MTIRLEEIGKFVKLEPGKGIALPGERRKVRLELNCQFPTQIMFDYGTEEPQFLCTVEGRETVEFIAEGPIRLWPDSEGQVWWWTAEIERSSVESDAPTFTKIAERQPRNHALEQVARAMQENSRRREAMLMDEIRALSGKVNTLVRETENGKSAKRKGAGAGNPSAPAGEPADSAGAVEAPKVDDNGGGDAATK